MRQVVGIAITASMLYFGLIGLGAWLTKDERLRTAWKGQ